MILVAIFHAKKYNKKIVARRKKMMHSSYALRYVKDDDRNWVGIPHQVSVNLQFGTRYGVLCIDISCPHCEVSDRIMYFFTLRGSDKLLYMMQIRNMLTDETSVEAVYSNAKNIEVTMPNAMRGHFVLESMSPSFDNKYILRLLASADDTCTDDTCITDTWKYSAFFFDLFYSNLQREIVSRACIARLATFARRGRMRAPRMIVLYVLSVNGINEASLRLQIVSCAGLY
jgi:hypothetical protein